MRDTPACSNALRVACREKPAPRTEAWSWLPEGEVPPVIGKGSELASAGLDERPVVGSMMLPRGLIADQLPFRFTPNCLMTLREISITVTRSIT